MVLNYPDYAYERWHGTLLMWAIILLMFVINVWGIRLLPVIELIGGICHVVFFIVLLITLVVLAPQQPASFVFTEFLNNGGWSSDGVSFCVGLLTAVYSLSGQ
jgi:amino acid transporter